MARRFLFEGPPKLVFVRLAGLTIGVAAFVVLAVALFQIG